MTDSAEPGALPNVLVGMRALAAILALLTQDTRTPAYVDRLVRLLDSDAIEQRESAAAELVRMGEPILPLLRQTRDAERNASLLAHIRHVIARIELDIRRRGFKGGNTVAGLCTRVSLADPKKRPKAGQEIELAIEFMNVSENHVSFVPPKAWDTSLPRSSSQFTSSQAELEVEQVKGDADLSCSGLIG